jgi:phage gpG-like protein
MTLDELKLTLDGKIKQLEELVGGDKLREIVATEAINYFKDSFQQEGFNGNKWQDVKRRDPNSEWYGYSGQTGKFSEAATIRPILTGETGRLGNNFKWEPTAEGLKIINDTPYAAVHQFGLPAKIYGKKTFQMTARPFMGATPALSKKIRDSIVEELKKIIK